MRQLIALIFLAVPLVAQTGDVALDALTARKSLYATLLNGTTQYWSRATPTGMDLNGPEKITNTSTSGFVDSVGAWANLVGSTATISRTTVDKRSGAASGLIKTTGAGDTTTNFVYIPASSFGGALIAGLKYTLEVWARSGTATSTLTANLGTQSATSGNLSTTFGSFTKVVWNLTANGGEDTLKLYANKAIDSLYVDDVSLTQAYDAVVMAVVKPSLASGTSKMIVDQSSAGGGNPRAILYLNATTELLSSLVSDGVTTITNVTGGSSLVDGSWHTVALTLDRSGNLIKYVDATATGNSSIAAVGKVTFTTVNIGVNGAGATFFPGSIGPVQVIRFDALPSDIASTIAYVNATWRRRGFPKSYTGGTVVLDVDWKTGGLDKSNSGNHLTGTASPTRTKVR
jgi:hypothetical protein